MQPKDILQQQRSRRTRRRLGYDQVVWGDIETLSQFGGFRDPKLDAATGDIVARGPLPRWPEARLRSQRMDPGASIFTGIAGPIDFARISVGQSTGVASSSSMAGNVDPTYPAPTVQPPQPGTLVVFNGGDIINQAGGGPSAYNTPTDPSQLDRFVDYKNDLNATAPGREAPTPAACERMALGRRPGFDDRFIPIVVNKGSRDFLETMGFTNTITAWSWSATGGGRLTLTVAATNVKVGQLAPIISGSNGSNHHINGTATVLEVPTATTIVIAMATDPGTMIAGGTFIDYAQSAQDGIAAVTRMTELSLAAGRTPIVFSLDLHGYEAEDLTSLMEFWKIFYDWLEIYADRLASITGQSWPVQIFIGQVLYPRMDGFHETDAFNLKKLPFFARGPGYYSQSIERLRTFARYPYMSAVAGEACNHYNNLGTADFGAYMGAMSIDIINGTYDEEPFIVRGSIERVANSATVTFTLNKPCEIRTDLHVTDPGGRGFSYYANGTKIPILSVDIDDTEGTIVLDADPATISPVSNLLFYAGDNATTYVEPVLGQLPLGTAGLGEKDGLRGQVFGKTVKWYNHRHGGPMASPLLATCEPVDVYASTGDIVAAMTELGMSAKLVWQIGNSACVASSSAQTITNLGSSGATNNFYRGASSSSGVDDPTVIGTPGDMQATTALQFDGGDYCVPTGTPDVMADAHKATGELFCIVAGKAAPAFSNARYIAATGRIEGSGQQAASCVRFAANGLFGFVADGDAGAGSYALSASTPVTAGSRYVQALGIKAGAKSWVREPAVTIGSPTSTSSLNVGFVHDNVATFASPSSNAAQTTLRIGRNGDGSRLMANGDEISLLILHDVRPTQEQALPLIRTVERWSAGLYD
jgi:Tfp pilus assembly protein PilW